MMIVLVACLIWREKGGDPMQTSWGERMRVLPSLLPPTFIFMVVVGAIYMGIATPTEAASLGVVSALVLAWWEGKLTISMLRAAAEGTMRTTAMIMMIIIAAQFLNFVLAAIGITDTVAQMMESMGLGKITTMLVIIVFYLVLGCFMETISMMILTTPFIFPIVVKFGWDPIWWGIVLTILIEAALITPPVGLNLYVVQGMRERGLVIDVIWGALPFVAVMMLMIFILMVYPDLALWLPNYVMGKG
jgi:tripartite ATP-independent transporter DctM subunit